MNTRTVLNVFFVAALGAPALAAAALGEPVESVRSDKTSMRAAGRPMRTDTRYTVHEIQTPTGTVVRQYATVDGIIFAVAWDGPTLPNIKSLLGKYFDQYSSALQGQHGGHSRAYVNQDQLIVQSHGRLRAFSGHAYLPEMLPEGVSPDELQ